MGNSDHSETQGDLAIFGKLRRVPDSTNFSEGARVGDVIGDFRLVSRIARGGQGEVWEAEQLSLSRRVALKLVLPQRINKKTLALFAREARAGGRLSHPGIVSVYGYGKNDGRHWIAQELIEGAWTLRGFIDEVRNEEHLPENYYRSVAVFVAELADALQAAHDQGIIHRDVKPQNVLVTHKDRPKLTDFGLARITDETAVSITGDFAGTWLYMSPEQVTAKRIEIDHRTDIFSLGVVMYEMLALQRPFDGDTTHQIAENIVLRDPPDLRKIRSRVPRDLAIICGKALEKLRDSRFQTMAELAADLRRYLTNRPIHAQPPTLVERGVKWVRRNPTKTAAAAAAALAFGVITGLLLRISKQKFDLQTTNSALVAKTLEAQRKTTDVFRLSLTQDFEDLEAKAATLWPAYPSKIDSFRNWITEATALVAELPSLESKREELRQLAIPRTPEEAQKEQRSHPDFEKLAPLQDELESKRSQLAVRLGTQEVQVPTVDWSEYPEDPKSLNALAGPMLAPEERRFGQEPLGLALAQHAAELNSTPDPDNLFNVAWGHFALGQDQLALQAGRSAVSAATEQEQAPYQTELERLEAAVSLASSPAGLAALQESIADLNSEAEELRLRVSERRLWTFPTDQEEETRPRWWNSQLTGLIAKLKSLTAKDTGLLEEYGLDENLGWSVPKRLELAQRLKAGFAPGGEFAARWARDLAAIHRAYPGLNLTRQMGLVPIGADPKSGLWEFWHIQSGTEPLRDRDGKLVLEEASGLVFVLLPKGEFWMGASRDPDFHNFDKDAAISMLPVHSVKLSAFFLSKYEATQAQWERITGATPSSRTAKTRTYVHSKLHPVEQVSWWSCDRHLRHLGLNLPTEAQWEYACRTGTESSLPFLRADFASYANIRDEAFLLDFPNKRASAEWNDGYTAHAPVGSFRPNDFGLHDMLGNVWEWCEDQFELDFYYRSPTENPVNSPIGNRTRITRGGSWANADVFVRCAVRDSRSPTEQANVLGVRPARLIVP